ncbi:Cytochrome P450 3A5 [Orchesella cincta]|uniref:Cytochrome P450 3A5 n=1 Tax=Orchesella cincta TaxID=48709 RepID=A0A1D2N7G9_ORCCI|nr:Cytochrome P450 3A5 [Orchesella cincta]
MILFVVGILVGLASVVSICLVLYARWNYGVLEAAGVPVIKPSFFLGSVPNLHQKIQTEEDIKRFQEYGPIWGLYEGRTPIINICDPDLIRAIFLKDVDHFYDRRVGHFGDPRIDEILDYLPGEKWKKMRKMQTILFSSGKIRQYNKQLADAAFDFVHSLRNKCDKNGRTTVNTRDAMDIISLDGIARVSFGVKLENVEDSNNRFYKGLKRLLGEGLEYDSLYSLSMTFPFLHKLAPSFNIEPVLFDTFKEIINSRRAQRISESSLNPDVQKPCNDLADFLVDCYENLNSSDFKRLGISETTILAQALNVTALDMISATMTMISYYLAINPNIQEKLHQELDEVIDGKYEGRIDSETVHQLPYLSACIDETLRLAPPLIRPERCCTKDWTSPDGTLKIKKGTVVMSPLWAVHRNPKYFHKPETFQPERFIQGTESYAKDLKHSYSYTPFGVGYRNCIGMRLAIETLN